MSNASCQMGGAIPPLIFYTRAVKMFCINESTCLLHSISFGFIPLFMQVECLIHPHLVSLQHLSFNPVVSFSYWVSFISVPLYKLRKEIWGITASRASAFRAFFPRNHCLSWGSPQIGDWANDLKNFRFYRGQNRDNKAICEQWLWTIFYAFSFVLFLLYDNILLNLFSNMLFFLEPWHRFFFTFVF